MNGSQGYVVLQGQKIYILVRLVQDHRYITALTGAPIGKPAHMTEIEQTLRRMNGARDRLLSGKAIPI